MALATLYARRLGQVDAPPSPRKLSCALVLAELYIHASHARQRSVFEPLRRRCVAAQIETLAGQVLAAEVDSSASLVAMRAGIERETGVLAEQQRLLILGAPSKGFCLV